MIYSAYKDVTPIKLNIAKLIFKNPNQENLNPSNIEIYTLPKQNYSKFKISTINQDNNPPKKRKKKIEIF